MLQRLVKAINSVIKGKEEVVELAVSCLLAGGHLLLEDLPGTGKTTLALALARATGCSFRKVQFTSDLLPADILGSDIYRPADGDFTFKPGPIFTNILLADEINRAPPRTQSALLEAMSEGQVSVSTGTYSLPQPFFVIATQNPLDLYGTYPLPESQLDRFLMRLSMGYPPREEEKKILKEGDLYAKAKALGPVTSPEELLATRRKVRGIMVSDKLADYILNIAEASRKSPMFRYGLSTRGLLALKSSAQALAYIRGRDYAIPDDVKKIFIPVAYHRLIPKEELSQQARIEMLKEFLNSVRVPL